MQQQCDKSLALQEAEKQRNCLSKQMAMVRELEALGTARASHTLNTITQRYMIYKRDAENFNAVKQRIQREFNNMSCKLSIYFEHLIVIPTPGQDLLMLQHELSQQQQQNMLSNQNEFEMVRLWLRENHLEKLHDQSDFTRQEMNNTLFQLNRSGLECMELIIKYVGIMQFYPRKNLQQTRMVRLQNWCDKLLQEKLNAPTIKREMEQWLTAMNEQNMEIRKRNYAVQYSELMEKNWIELNFDLHQAVNELNELQKQVVSWF